jgi:hypothetical protein
MLTASFNLEWPELVLELFAVQEQAGSATDHVFSVDCFLEDDSKSVDENMEQVYYQKVILMALLPVFIAVFSIVFWFFYCWYNQTWHYLKDELIATLVILLFLAQPNIVKSMFSVFSCREIESGEFWITTNLDIKCWTNTHLMYSLIVAFPAIMCWGIGIPTICLVALYKSRRKLATLSVRLKFGFLFNGYEETTYYWEFIILYRKILIICCSVFLGNMSIPIQALTVMLLLIFTLHLHHEFQPFMNDELNQCESRSILVSAITIYCGLYYLTGHLDYYTRLWLFVVIVVANVYFLFYWGRKMFGAGIEVLIQKVPFLRKRWGYRNRVKDGFDNDFVVNKHSHDHYTVKGKKSTFSIAPYDYTTKPNKFEGELPANNMNELYM